MAFLSVAALSEWDNCTCDGTGDGGIAGVFCMMLLLATFLALSEYLANHSIDEEWLTIHLGRLAKNSSK